MIFFFFFVINYVNCLFKFYFVKKFLPKDVGKSINYLDYLYNNDLNTELLIGNPPQKIPMTIKYDKEQFYLASPLAKGIYNHNQSNTFYSNFSEVNYTKDGIEKGFISTEKIILNSKNNQINISNIIFFYLTKPIIPKINYASLGLLFMEKSIYKDYNILIQLKKKNLIDNYCFSFLFLNDIEGILYIGNYPHQYNNSFYDYFDFYHFHIALSNQLTEMFDKIYYGKHLMNAIGSFYFNLSLGGIIGNYFIQNLIEFDFFSPLIEKKKCEKKLINAFLYYECDNDVEINLFKNLSFYNKEINYTFVLTYEDLFDKINGKIYCKLIFRKTMLPIFILGQPFLKKYYFMFDQDKKLMGFYKKLKEKKKSFLSIFHILFIILIFFLVFLIIILIKMIMKKPLRIRASELEENMIN